MSKPRYRWWGYSLNVLKAYPELCAKLQQLKEPRITVNYDPSRGGKGGISRPTERLCEELGFETRAIWRKRETALKDYDRARHGSHLEV